MEILLVDNCPFDVARYASSDTLLMCSGSSTYKPRTVRGNESHEEYIKKVLAASNGTYFCIHVKKNPANPNDCNKCMIRLHGFFWEDFEAWMEGLKVRIQLSFSVTAGTYDYHPHPAQMCAEIPIPKVLEPSSAAKDSVESCIKNSLFLEATDVLVYYGHDLFDSGFGNKPFRGCATITLLSDGNEMNAAENDQLAILNNPWRGIARINRAILDSKLHSDVTITSKYGSEHSCNKAFLAAHSSVLKAMLETDMKETKTNKVEMKDMTSDGVQALLEYLYTFELDQAIDKCDIALELLEAGHKYDIESLEKDVTSMILKKDEDWFSVDMAFNLFLFVRKVESMKDIKMKAASVLMKKPNEFMECKAYRKEREKNIVVAHDALQELFCLAVLK